MKKKSLFVKMLFSAFVAITTSVAFAATTVAEQELDERDFQSTISLAGHLIGLQNEKDMEKSDFVTNVNNYVIETVLYSYQGKTLLRVKAPNYGNVALADVVLNYWGMQPVYFDKDERLVVVNPGGGDGDACTMVVFFNQTKPKNIAIPKDSKGCFSYPSIKKQTVKNFWSGKETCFLVLAKSAQQYKVNGKTNVYYKIVGRDGNFEWVFGEDVILNKGIFNSLPEEKL